MDGIAEPSQLLPTMTSMATTIGTLLEGIMGTSNVESNEDSTAEELCSQLSSKSLKEQYSTRSQVPRKETMM